MATRSGLNTRLVGGWGNGNNVTRRSEGEEFSKDTYGFQNQRLQRFDTRPGHRNAPIPYSSYLDASYSQA